MPPYYMCDELVNRSACFEMLVSRITELFVSFSLVFSHYVICSPVGFLQHITESKFSCTVFSELYFRSEIIDCLETTVECDNGEIE